MTVSASQTGEGATVRPPRSARARAGRRRALRGGGLLFLLPVLVLEIGVFFAPLIYLAARSLYDWQPGGVSTFIGGGNYAELFADPEFWQVVGNQLFYLLGLPLWVIAPLVVAYLLREHVARAGLWRAIYFLPAVMSPAIVGLVFRSLLSTKGPVDSFLDDIGWHALSLPWLTDQNLVKPVIIVLVLWAGFGTGVLIFSAAFGAVPQEIFEAARLDGAGFWREFWDVPPDDPAHRGAVDDVPGDLDLPVHVLLDLRAHRRRPGPRQHHPRLRDLPEVHALRLLRLRRGRIRRAGPADRARARSRRARAAADPARVRKEGGAMSIRSERRVKTTIAALLAIPFIVPFVFLIGTALRTRDDYIAAPGGIPKAFTFDNIIRAWSEASLGRALLNSLLVCLVACLVCTVTALAGAFWFRVNEGRVAGGRAGCSSPPTRSR